MQKEKYFNKISSSLNEANKTLDNAYQRELGEQLPYGEVIKLKEIYDYIAESDKRIAELRKELEREKNNNGELVSLIDAMRYEDTKIDELQKENAILKVENNIFETPAERKRYYAETIVSAIFKRGTGDTGIVRYAIKDCDNMFNSPLQMYEYLKRYARIYTTLSDKYVAKVITRNKYTQVFIIMEER